MDVLSSDDSCLVLYVSPTRALGYHFLQRLAVRVAAGEDQLEPKLINEKIQQYLCRMVFVHDPYSKSCRKHIALKDGLIVVKDTNDLAEHFALAVFDEGHKILDHLNCARTLLLTDEAQSSSVKQSFPDMPVHKLTEIVRSTKRI